MKGTRLLVIILLLSMFCVIAGDIGGNMGLFLGCSVLTIAEFVDLAWSGILRRINRIKDQSADEDEGSV